MKKLGLGLVALVTVAVASVFFFNGMMLERLSRKSMDNINVLIMESGSDMKLELVSINKGLWSSVMEWQLNLGSLGRELEVKHIRFTEHVRPGIGELVTRTDLSANPWYADWVTRTQGGKDPLHIENRWGWNGNMATQVRLDGFHMDLEGEETLVIRPGEIRMETNADVTRFETQGQFQGILTSDTFKLEDFAFESVQKKISRHIWTGNTRLSIGNFFLSENLDDFWLTNAWMTSKVSKATLGDTLTLDMEYGMDSADLPQLELGESQMKCRLDGISASGYENFMNLYVNMLRETGFGAADEARVSAWINANQPRLMAALESFLKKGLALEISDAKVSLPEGDVLGDFSLSLTRDTTLAQIVPMAMQPGAALNLFSISSGVRLPGSFAQAYPMLTLPLYPGMATGLFIPDGDTLTLGMESRDGRLYLNGSEFNLGQ
ncbi:MAG: YdgA family protein [Desulfobacterales bacterium]|nr:YdgA family protein [Desulfobacterales bacterium]